MGIDFCNDTEKEKLKSLFDAKRDIDIKPLYTYLCPIIIFVCFFSIIFNAILMSISRQSKVVNKSPILLLSLNLAVTDLIASTFNGLGILFNSYLPEVYNINMSRCVMLVFEVVRCAALVASALHLLALAFVHYRGIVNPLHYRSTIFFSQHLSRTINMVSIACWIIPLTIMVVWFFSSPCQGFQTHECDYLFLLGFTYRYTILTLFALPLLLMSAIYLRIFIIISRHQRGRRLNHERSTLARGVACAPSTVGTAAALNLAGQQAVARCASCAARNLEETSYGLATVSLSSAGCSTVMSPTSLLAGQPAKSSSGANQIAGRRQDDCHYDAAHLAASNLTEPSQAEVSNGARLGVLTQWSQPAATRPTDRGTSVDKLSLSGHSPALGCSPPSMVAVEASGICVEIRGRNLRLAAAVAQDDPAHVPVDEQAKHGPPVAADQCDRGEEGARRNLVFFPKANQEPAPERSSSRRPVGKTVSLAEPHELHQRRLNRIQSNSVKTSLSAQTADRQQGSSFRQPSNAADDDQRQQHRQRRLLIRQATEVSAHKERLKCTCDSQTRASHGNKQLARANTIGERSLSSASRQLIGGRGLLPPWATNRSLISKPTHAAQLRVSSSLADKAPAKPLLSTTLSNSTQLAREELQPAEDEVDSRLVHHHSLTTNLSTNSSRFEPQRRHFHAAALPQTNTKALVTTLLILGTYFISYVPAIIYQVLTCIDHCPYPLYRISFSRRVLLGAMTTLLLIAKSIIDPFIYSYRMSEIQVAINRYLSKRRSKCLMATSMQASQRLNTTGYHMSSINYNLSHHQAANKHNNNHRNSSASSGNNNVKNDTHNPTVPSERIQNTSLNSDGAQNNSSVKILNDVVRSSPVGSQAGRDRSSDKQPPEARDRSPEAAREAYSIAGQSTLAARVVHTEATLAEAEGKDNRVSRTSEKQKKRAVSNNDSNIVEQYQATDCRQDHRACTRALHSADEYANKHGELPEYQIEQTEAGQALLRDTTTTTDDNNNNNSNNNNNNKSSFVKQPVANLIC